MALANKVTATTFTDGTAVLESGNLTGVKLSDLSNGIIVVASGDGTLTVDETAYVPYSGATGTLDLGGQDVSVDDSSKVYLGSDNDAYLEFDGNSLNIVANNTTSGDDLNLTADEFTFSPTAGQVHINDGGDLIIGSQKSVAESVMGIYAQFASIQEDYAGAYFIAYDNAGFPFNSARRARGSVASPSAVQANDILFRFGGGGYDNAGFPTGNEVMIEFKAAEAYDATSHGTYILFSTTAAGSTSTNEKMRLTSEGHLKLGGADSQKLYFGEGDDYSIEWDGSDAVHTITAGDFVFTGGNVGIGTSSPLYKLDILLNDDSELGAGNGVNLENSDGYFRLGNGTSTADNFQPTFLGKSSGDKTALFFVGEIDPADDTGDTGVIVFQSRRTSSVGISNRNLVEFWEYTDPYLEIDADRNMHFVNDSQKLYFGAGDDATIEYDGDHMQFDSQVAGTGDFVFNNGAVQGSGGFKSSDGSEGWSGWFDDGTNFRATVKNGLIVNVEASASGGYSAT